MKKFVVTHVSKDGVVSQLRLQANSVLDVMEEMIEGGFTENSKHWSVAEVDFFTEKQSEFVEEIAKEKLN